MIRDFLKIRDKHQVLVVPIQSRQIDKWFSSVSFRPLYIYEPTGGKSSDSFRKNVLIIVD